GGEEEGTDTFVCDTDSGTCRATCNPEFDTESTCAGFDGWCGPTSDGQYACLDAEGDSELEDDCDEGEACVVFSSAGGICVETGDAEIGDECAWDPDDPFGDYGCEAGARCLSGHCVTLCDLSDWGEERVTCEESVPCTAVFYPGQYRPMGACLGSCDPYSQGQCAEGSLCAPYVDQYAVVRFSCREGAEDAVSAGDECSPLTEVCEEGFACVEDGETHRCLQTCGGENATCTAGTCSTDEPLWVCRTAE
ncbi:MAG: hypothetical protein KC561_07870, partial [Myxococcales bacterium]|nr:hypothetical protein [Myxococcales bacterium]